MSNTTPQPQRLIFFNEGDQVRLKIPNAPVMLVQRILKNEAAKSSRERLVGIECIWFEDGHLKEKSFNTKDLEHVHTAGRVAAVSAHAWGEEGQ